MSKMPSGVVVLGEALGDTKNKMYNIYIHIYIYIWYMYSIFFLFWHALSPRIMVPSKMTVYLKDVATIGWSHFSLPWEEAGNYGAREGANPGTFRKGPHPCRVYKGR